MPRDQVYSIAQLRSLFLPTFQEYGVKKAVLFGSYANGTATARSDIDLFVDSGLRGLRFFGFAGMLADAANKNVDVIDVAHINSGSRVDQEIARTGVVLYEQ